MKKLICYILLFSSLKGLAQQGDVVVLEKRGANLKTYSAGTDIDMQTIYHQWFEGTIEAIRHDSIFINGVAFHYKEIAEIRMERKKLNYRTDGTILIAAGVGVLVLGGVNGLYRGDPAKSWYTPASFITSGGLIGLGLLLRGSNYKKYEMGEKYTLQYLALSAPKN